MSADERAQTGVYDDDYVFGSSGPEVLPPPGQPMAVARVIAGARYATEDDVRTLQHWRGGWWRWLGPRWVEVEHRAIRGDAYRFTEAAHHAPGKLWAPNRRNIADLLEALQAIVHLPETVVMPRWLGHDHVAGGPFVSVANGLLDISTRELHEHDPLFFNATAVPFDYDPDAPDPERWEAFLDDLWGDDQASKDVLAEWFGYVISGRLDLHKILLLIGPTRAGKGVITRTLERLVGRENTVGLLLASLSTEFGLQPLLGKTLATVSDARLNGRGAQTTVERLLSMSGEDTLTVNRKYREQWTGKLPCRLMLCSNELPQLGDASMAIAGRFVPLLLTENFYGRENHRLEDELAPELPGILNMALDGLTRLTEQGRFTRPPNVDDTIRTLQDLASPVGAFVRDRCRREGEVKVDDVYVAWKQWAELNGYKSKSAQTLGKDLRAVVPGLKGEQPRDGDSRYRVYVGLSLKARS